MLNVEQKIINDVDEEATLSDVFLRGKDRCIAEMRLLFSNIPACIRVLDAYEKISMHINAKAGLKGDKALNAYKLLSRLLNEYDFALGKKVVYVLDTVNFETSSIARVEKTVVDDKKPKRKKIDGFISAFD